MPFLDVASKLARIGSAKILQLGRILCLRKIWKVLRRFGRCCDDGKNPAEARDGYEDNLGGQG